MVRNIWGQKFYGLIKLALVSKFNLKRASKQFNFKSSSLQNELISKLHKFSHKDDFVHATLKVCGYYLTINAKSGVYAYSCHFCRCMYKHV